MYLKNTHFHFVGIGGIGMSGIAKVLMERGYQISGCDKNTQQKSVLDLQKNGCIISAEHNSTICHDTSINVMVYSTDIPTNNPEFEHARRKGISIVHRAIILAQLTQQSYTIGVAGSHGKTTTTSLISHLLLEAAYDPTIIVGGYLHALQSNARNGKSSFLVAETDESDRSLLHLFPTVAVLTNIDIEHMNTYHNLHDLTVTFDTFLEKIPAHGTAIMCYDDAQVRTLLPRSKQRTITYGITPISHTADFTLKDLTLYPTYSTYTLILTKTNEQYPVTLSIPGEHNVANSLGALAAANSVGIPLTQAITSLATFTGVDRRFTYRGKFEQLEVFDDYGHHPTEIACTLKNARRYAGTRPLSVVFQPHRYTRTHLLWNDFINLFGSHPIDNLIITDIYPAHEAPIENVSSAQLVEEIKRIQPQCNIHHVPYEADHSSLHSHIKALAANSGVLLIQGAGTVTGLSQSITR